MDFYKRYKFNPKTDLLGKGGFSKVYKANDTLLDRTVALKFFTGHGFEKYQVLNEIKKVIKFEHSNLCKYYDVAVIETTNIIGEPETMEVGIMEYLDAGDLKNYLKSNPQDIDKLLIDVLKGLSYLHKRGIVHRDLKPPNIIVKMVDDEPVAKITDFGISKLLSDDDTSSSALIGTIEYMAPEQFNPKKYGIGGRITTNLDLWSFGLLVYEAVENKPLFGSRSKGTSAEQIMRNILTDSYLSRTKTLPLKYQAIVDKCLVKNASDRVQNALELIPMFAETSVSLNKQSADGPANNGRNNTSSQQITDSPRGLDPVADLEREEADEAADDDLTENISAIGSTNADSARDIDARPMGPAQHGEGNADESETMQISGDPTQLLPVNSREIKVDNVQQTSEDPHPPEPNKNKKLALYAVIAVLLIAGFFVFRQFRSTDIAGGAKGTPAQGTNTNNPVDPPLPVPQPNLVKVSGGRFIIGNQNPQDTTLLPAHAVTVPDFLVNKYEVTIDEFRRFINDDKYITSAEKEGSSYIFTEGNWVAKKNVNWRHDLTGNLVDPLVKNMPVLHVSWFDANRYCEWLSEKNNRRYRLPTEAEWEIAAKGGRRTANFVYSGSNNLDEVAWYGNNSGVTLHAVGGKRANELGLFDMSGNVVEWCNDWFDEHYYEHSPPDSPMGPSSGTSKVLKGGSWFTKEPAMLGSSYRDGFPPTTKGGQLGFRICEVL